MMPLPADIFESTDANDLPLMIWEHIMGQMQHTPGADFQEAIACLPPGLRKVYFLTVYSGDIENGGISQLFYNQSPYEIGQIIDTLNEIGATESVNLLKKAATLFEDHFEWPRDSRDRWLGKTYEIPAVEALTTHYFDSDNTRHDYQLLTKYLLANRHECFSDAIDS